MNAFWANCRCGLNRERSGERILIPLCLFSHFSSLGGKAGSQDASSPCNKREEPDGTVEGFAAATLLGTLNLFV